MTPHFITANPMARWLSRWRLQRWLLVCGWVVAAIWPAQQALATSNFCNNTIQGALYSNSDTLVAVSTIKFNPSNGATAFDGYLQVKFSSCSTNSITTFGSNIVAGQVAGNSGLDITPQDSAMSGTCSKINSTTGIFPGGVGNVDCTAKFYFKITANSSVNPAPFTISAGSKLANAATSNFWLSTGMSYKPSGAASSLSWFPTSDLKFVPFGCNVTTTAPTVFLNTVSSSALAVQTATSNWKAFTISLNNCLFAGASSLSISSSFDYTSHSATDTSLIKNTAASGAASNVGVQLATAASESNVVVSTTNNPTQTYTLGSLSSSNTGTTLTLYARLKKASSGTVTAGKVNATATFTVTYQ